MIERASRLEGLEVSNKIAYTFKTSELKLHGSVGVIRHSKLLGH
jgi:hypothetical protein